MLMWNVYYADFNEGRIKTMNVFEHYRFWEDCIKNVKKNKNDKEAFEKQLLKDLMYYYWSKCEWEIVIEHFPPSSRTEARKVDVFNQISLNWNIFINYVWDNRKEIKKETK